MDPVILLLLGSITTDWVWLLIFTWFLDHTQRRTTVGRTPLNEWSVRRRDLYLTTHNSHIRQTSMTPDVLRIFILPLKIRRLRPGLNRTYNNCDFIRGIHYRVNFVSLQRRSKIFGEQKCKVGRDVETVVAWWPTTRFADTSSEK